MSTRRGEDFDAYFRELYPRACRAAWRVTGDEDLAEDAALEALTRAFVRWPTLRTLAYRDAWVLRVAINEALGQLRRRGHKSIRLGSIRSDAPDNLEDVLTTRLALAAALRQLPKRQREAVELRYLADLSEDDTAAALGVSNGTVKSHLHRAAKSLRLILDKDLLLELLDARP
jgi:RNA polymerase sigma factor (sigma-70 family)